MAEPATTTTTTTTTPPPLTAENHLPPPSQAPLNKQKPHDPTISSTTTTTTATNQPTQANQQSTQKSQSPTPPTPLSVPITELRNLSASLTAFQCCFNDLQHHLNSLKTAVDSLITIPAQQNLNIAVLPSPNESSPPIETPMNETPINETAEKQSTLVKSATEEENLDENPIEVSGSELQTLCETMCGKGLRRFMMLNLKDVHKLREQVPKALKHAPNPARLVLESSGRFFLQGSKAYVNMDSPMVTGRKASVLILECFLLMMDGENGVEIEKPEKEEADHAAVLWRNRLINEGGVAKAFKTDARGLLLWIGCFGVPSLFKNENVRDLLHASYAREISGLLKRSSLLMAKVPEIIEGMIKNKMEVGAVDIAYTFGLEDRFNPQMILTSFLRESKEPWKKVKKGSQASPAAQNEARRKQWAALKSVVKCLESHKIDPSKLLPGWQVSQKISTLEKDIAVYNKKKGEEKTQKRKADEAEPAKKLKPQEVKRSRYIGQGLQQQQIAVSHVNSQRHLMESGIPGHLNNYSASPTMLHAPAPGTAPYAGVYGGTLVDSAGHVINHSVHHPSYGWRGDPALTERIINHSYAGQPSSSSINGLYGPSSTSLDGYVMVPSTSSVGVSTRNAAAASDLYQFADAVFENEYQPRVVSAHHNPYSY